MLSLLTPCPSLGYVWTVSTESVESPPRHPMCVIGSSSSPLRVIREADPILA